MLRKLCIIVLSVLTCAGISLAQKVQKLSVGEINTDAFDEFSPVLNQDGSSLYFTRAKDPSFNKTLIIGGTNVRETYSLSQYEYKLKSIFQTLGERNLQEAYQSSFNQDIWKAQRIDGQWTDVVHPPYPLNNALTNSAISYINRSETLVLVNQFEENGNMKEGFSMIDLHGPNGINFPTPIEINGFDAKGEEVSAFVSMDGEILICSKPNARNQNSYDLFVAFYTGVKGHYTALKPMGNVVNTRFRETTPFLSRDNRRLYFASDRPNGLGGMDIYECERLDYTYTSWTTPKLLDMKVNTAANESHPYEWEGDKRQIYFSSDRDGSLDIFMVEEEEPIVKRILEIKGRIINKATGKSIASDLYYGPTEFEHYLEYYSTFNGRFAIKTKTGEKWKFQAEKANFYAPEVIIDMDSLAKDGGSFYEITLYLEPIPTPIHLPESIVSVDTPEAKIPVVPAEPPVEIETALLSIEDKKVYEDLLQGKKIILKDIRFKKSTADILASSQDAVQSLYSIMDQYSDITILISGHTDNIGPKNLLQKLSFDRAEKIKQLLVEKGILAQRIKTIGYGSSKSLNSNETESERSLNRRVEISIIQ